jgi:hypothetical protein
MRVIGIGIILLAASMVSALAQVPIEVEVTLNQDQFLLGEALQVTARVINRSGRTLPLGRDNDWLTFSIDSGDGSVIKKGDVPVEGEFDLDPSKAAVVRVDLEPYFVITRPVRYSITATFRYQSWKVVSPPRTFEVIQGSTLWEQEIGVPPAPGATNALPEVRKYAIQQINSKGQMRLFLRLSDERNRPLRVLPIGRQVSFGRPEAQVDRLSRLHMLYQSGPSVFNYGVFDCQGDLLVRQTYESTYSHPHLRPDRDGNIVINGGTRTLTDHDLPPRADEDDLVPTFSGTNLPAAVSSTNKPAANTNGIGKSKS